MLFYLLLGLKLSFTANPSADALFPSTCSLFCADCICGGWCFVWWLYAHPKWTPCTLDQRTSVKMYRVLIMQELFCCSYEYNLHWSKLQIIKQGQIYQGYFHFYIFSYEHVILPEEKRTLFSLWLTWMQILFPFSRCKVLVIMGNLMFLTVPCLLE